MQINIREFSFLNDLWDRIDIIEVEERKMKKWGEGRKFSAGSGIEARLPPAWSAQVPNRSCCPGDFLWTNRGYFLP